MPYSDLLVEQILALDDLLKAISRTVAMLAEDDGSEGPEDASQVAENLNDLKFAKQQLATIYKNYEQGNLEQFRKPISWAGHTFETGSSVSRTQWKHGELASRVADRIVQEAFDFDTGEITKSFEEMVRELLRYAGVGYWKKKELLRLGIDVDDYCKVEPKETISIKKG